MRGTCETDRISRRALAVSTPTGAGRQRAPQLKSHISTTSSGRSRGAALRFGKLKTESLQNKLDTLRFNANLRSSTKAPAIAFPLCILPFCIDLLLILTPGIYLHRAAQPRHAVCPVGPTHPAAGGSVRQLCPRPAHHHGGQGYVRHFIIYSFPTRH